MIKIILVGNPISTQHLYGIRVMRNVPIVYMKKAGKELKQHYQGQAKGQYAGAPLKDLLACEIDLYFRDNRVRDWDNWHKISMDALKGIVWDDDKLIKKTMINLHVDKENPRIEILVSPLSSGGAH